MVGILHPYLMGPAQGLLQQPQPAMGGGLLSAIAPGFADNPYAKAFGGISNTLSNALLGSVGHKSSQEAVRGAAQGAMVGMQADAVLRDKRKKEAEASAAKNRTIELLTKERPDLVPWIEAGAITPADAFNQVFAKPKNDATDDIREYQYAVQQGFQGTFRDYMTDMKKAGATNVTQIGGQTDKFRDVVDTESGKMFTGLVTEGYKAQRAKVQIDRLDQLLQQVPTGGAAAMSQIAGNFGISTEGLSEIQAAQAIINQLVPQQRPAGSGPMSDADLELFKQSLPRIINQPGGNQLIIETMRGIAEYTEMQGRIAQAVVNGEITPQEGTRLLNQLPDPLANIKTGATPKADPSEYKKRYGLE